MHIGPDNLWACQGMATPAGNGWYAVEQGHQLGRIVAFGASQNDIQRCVVAFDEEMIRRFDTSYSILLDALKQYSNRAFTKTTFTT